MTTPFEKNQQAQSTPWTTVADQEMSPQSVSRKNSRAKKSQNGKELKVLPYIFTTLVFMLIFIFSKQFKNLNADLFNSTGSGSTFGIATTTDILSEKNQTTGSWKTKTDEETAVSDQADENTWVIPTETENLEVEPLQTEVAEDVAVEPIQESSELLSENSHTAIVTENTESETDTATTFRLNTHTYDTVGTTQISENQGILDFENLHEAASEQKETQAEVVKIVKPTKNVQSGPGENLIVMLSLLFSTLAWFGIRKLKTTL